jgi:hypothetical protein
LVTAVVAFRACCQISWMRETRNTS